MKKKLIAIVLCLAMVAAVVCVLAACDDGDYDYEITVWVGEGTDTITKEMIETYNNGNKYGIKFKATVEIVSESKAAGNAMATPQSAADIFCFAQDQLARLVQSDILATVLGSAQQSIIANNDEGSVEATKVGGTIRAFPMTSDNGYFMYYDKRVISEEHKGNLNQIIDDIKNYKDSKNVGRVFSMNVTGGWYAASFFYATGAKSEWTTNDKGGFTDYVDTFNSAEGRIALNAMNDLFKSGVLLDSDGVSAEDFNAAIPAAAVISGIWDYNTALAALGEENLGIAPLPSFTVDGKDYQMVSYLGYKFMGVKAQTDGEKLLYLQDLATYLTGKACQEKRFDTVGWGPSNRELQQLDKVKASVALKALAETKTVSQGQYPTNWWSEVEALVGNVKDYGIGNVGNYLDTYNTNISKLVSSSAAQ